MYVLNQIIISGGHASPRKKCAMKIKQRKKKTTGAYLRIIIILMGATQKDRNGFEGSSDQLFLTQ